MSRHERLLSHAFARVEHRYAWKDTALYALGCGAGVEDLDLVYEPGMVALPSMATVLAYPGNWYADPAVGLDHVKIVHASERVELTGALPVEGHVEATLSVTGIHDKGPGRGAVIISSREVRDVATGRLLATVTSRVYARGDGGIGGGNAPLPRPESLPSRAPDRVARLPVSPRAAAIYRLLGDDNPLHVDPGFARAAGFDRPILHGLSTYGHVARAIHRDAPGARMRLMDCRFTAPVYPGDLLEVDLWDTPAGRAFRARVGPRVVIDQGEVGFDQG